MTTDTEVRPLWQRLIIAATGEEWGDGLIVTNVYDDYAEPGYRKDGDGPIVAGDWNSTRYPRGDDPPLTKEERLGPRLAAALEWAGCDLIWLDEWTGCDQCYKAMRTEADSYQWQMYGAFTGDGWTCADCILTSFESYLDEQLDNGAPIGEKGEHFDRAYAMCNWVPISELTALGFEKWEPGNEQHYESGWHPGQTDDPADVVKEIRRHDEDTDIVFVISEASQFYIGWDAYSRPTPEDA